MRRTKQAVQIFKNRGQLNQKVAINKTFIPKQIIIPRLGHDAIVTIRRPEYKSKKYFITQDKTCHPFVELTSGNVAWLQNFSDYLLAADKDERYAFFNSELDFTNPSLSGFRLYISTEEFIHVQVRKIPHHTSLYQLDYFELNSKKEPELLMVLCIDISLTGLNSIDLIYASPNLELVEEDLTKPESDLEYARRIATLFRHIMVYMRPFDYSLSGNHCLILPFPFFKEEQLKDLEIPSHLPDWTAKKELATASSFFFY